MPKSFGIKVNTDLVATIVENETFIHMTHFYPLWIQHNGVTHGSL